MNPVPDRPGIKNQLAAAGMTEHDVLDAINRMTEHIRDLVNDLPITVARGNELWAAWRSLHRTAERSQHPGEGE